jgi:integrase
LPASKSEPFRFGVPIHLAANPESTICPVQALKLLFKAYAADPSQPLFRSSAGPFTKEFVIDRVKTLLLEIGVNATGFSGHSFRKGAAATAKANGISRDNIKLLGRWKSDAVDIYMNEVDTTTKMHNILGLNAQLLTPTSYNPPTSSNSNRLPSSANSTLLRHRHSQ